MAGESVQAAVQACEQPHQACDQGEQACEQPHQACDQGEMSSDEQACEQVTTEIAVHRARIDEIDALLVRLLNERQEQALTIRALKEAAGLPCYDAERERDILARLLTYSEGPLDEMAIRAIYAAILNESKR